MITKEMYKVLKKVPRSPKETNSLKLLAKKIFEVNLLFDILQDALNCRFIMYTEHPRRDLHYSLEKSSFCLTEAGQLQIEEYENQRGSSAKTTWALIISGLSFVASVVAILLSLFDVQ